jgi:hypothetical protein
MSLEAPNLHFMRAVDDVWLGSSIFDSFWQIFSMYFGNEALKCGWVLFQCGNLGSKQFLAIGNGSVGVPRWCPT